MKERGLFLFVCLVLFQSSNAYASPWLSLEEALFLAGKNNPSVIESKKKVKIAESRYRKSKKFANPELELETSKIPNDIGRKNILTSDSVEGLVRFNQPLQTFGKRGLKISIAQDEKIQAELELKGILVEIKRKVKEQYTTALLEQKNIDLARDNLDKSQRLLDQVNVQYNAGKARNYELSRSRLVLAEARNNFLKVENNFIVALSELNILLGRDIRESFKLKDNLTIRGLDQDLDRFLKVALEKRSDVLSQEQEVIKKEKELKLSKRQRLPDVNLGLFVEREEMLYGLGAGISFEIPIWNQFQEDIKEAVVKKEMASMTLDTLRREVKLDVYIAFQNANLARRSVLNLKNMIKEANELLRIVTLEYQEGEASFLEYIEGLTSYKETKQKYLETLADYAGKLALLEQVIGGDLELKEGK